VTRNKTFIINLFRGPKSSGQHLVHGAGEQSLHPISPVRLTSPSFVKRRNLLHEIVT